ncbi:hypothetical protein [Sulfuriferula nivalis]|uniref:Lipoprotein n=1 Tax=Sulfuriferula nivalis TaxID=2675298 RepID=A0A809RGN7_9PROT|nr:hypothetical protein [Sulfuriferula nivalis]BBP00735.1 hypothetical protein SFSGTM_14430 [Sulfuriferula nivalis]
MKKILLSILVMLITGLVISGCTSKEEKQKEDGIAAANKMKEDTEKAIKEYEQSSAAERQSFEKNKNNAKKSSQYSQ